MTEKRLIVAEAPRLLLGNAMLMAAALEVMRVVAGVF